VRVVSFLPAGTEIVHALGAGDLLVGRSHECDYPAGVASLPIVSRPALELEGLSSGETDRAVADKLASGDSLYLIDEKLLRELEPDVILTQDLCKVCAPSGNELSRAVRDFSPRPEILFLTPRSIQEIRQNVLDTGTAVGRVPEARALVTDIDQRLLAVRNALTGVEPRRMVFLEWTDPPFCAGHWVPEMIEIAGGMDSLGMPNGDSRRVSWDDVVSSRPEVIVVSPCGYRLEQSAALAGALPDTGDATVFAVDANAYYARPGPRVAEAVELLAHLLHPSIMAWNGPDTPFRLIKAGRG
jgi:iron complex transport system substrate-binding protein